MDGFTSNPNDYEAKHGGRSAGLRPSIWIGVDPGASGAVLAMWDDGAIDHARNDGTEHDISNFVGMVKASGDCFAMLEQVHAMPKQGVSSTFKFGQSYGFLRGVLVANKIPFETVTPAKWQGALRCLSKGDKNVTKAMAQQLFPDHKWTHRTADAVLLAEYARRKQTLKGDSTW